MKLLVNFLVYGRSWRFKIFKLHSPSAFKTSLAPINHEMHSCLFDYLLHETLRLWYNILWFIDCDVGHLAVLPRAPKTRECCQWECWEDPNGGGGHSLSGRVHASTHQEFWYSNQVSLFELEQSFSSLLAKVMTLKPVFSSCYSILLWF